MSNSKSEDTLATCQNCGAEHKMNISNFAPGSKITLYNCDKCPNEDVEAVEPPQDTLKEPDILNTSEGHIKDTSLYDTEAENWLLELLIDYSGMDFCGAEECLSWQACREFMAEVENHIAQQRAKLFELIRSEVLNTVVEDDKIEAWKNGELLKILQDFTK